MPAYNGDYVYYMYVQAQQTLERHGSTRTSQETNETL